MGVKPVPAEIKVLRLTGRLAVEMECPRRLEDSQNPCRPGGSDREISDR